MATNTTNLKLLKKDPTTDGNDTFNIKTMLNDNWDKIDAAWPSKANASHTHKIADITNLQTTLDAKANASHTHTIGNITNLQTTLNSKANASDLTSHTGNTTVHITAAERTAWNAKANASHTHTIGNITNLQSTLDGKASAADLKNLAQKAETLDETSRQSTVLQHGLSVINGDVTSPADIEVQGRTLTSLGNATLETGKYYVLADKKTKLKWADSSVTSGVNKFKFSGNAGKHSIIRIANFEDKVSGSTMDNPHIAKRGVGPSLLKPSSFTLELENTNSGVGYPKIIALDGGVSTQGSGSKGSMPQHLFSFDLIAEVERNIGKIPRSTTAEKVQWLKDNLAKLTCNWYGYGTSPTGNKATLSRWNESDSTWLLASYHSKDSITLIPSVPSVSNSITSDGFIHFLAYAEPSDGTTTSTISTDYVELEIELKSTATLNSACVPLYEVDSDEYSKILGEWDENAVLSRYPKVEGTQHLQGIAMFAEGANLLPPFTEWTLHANAKVISPYELELNATSTYQSNSVKINVVPNVNYSMKLELDGYMYYAFYDYDGVRIGSVVSLSDKVGTFSITAPSNACFLDVGLSSRTTGKFTFKNPILTLGSTPKPFVPRNPSYLFADVKLGQIGTTKDILYKQDSQWYIRKAIEKDVELDGSLNWNWGKNYTGYKSFTIPVFSNSVESVTNTIKYDGKLLKKSSWSQFTQGSDNFYMETRDTNKAYVSVSNEDTGFAESYAPTPYETKAYFNGWRVKTTESSTNKPTAWKSVVDGTDAPKQELNYVGENKAPNYTPYKISYGLATPQIENVTDKIEGDIVVNGLTQVEVTSGVIVREKVTPQKSGDIYYIAHKTLGTTKYKNRKILSIYCNNKKDNQWYIRTHGNDYGKELASIESEYYDPTATYTVTYLALDRHQMTVNATEVKVTYANNIRSALDDVVVKQSDVEMSIKTAYDLVEQALQSTNDNKTKISQAETDIQEINDTRMLKVLKTNKDSEGIFKTVTYKRKSDNTIYCVSTLSGGTSPLYTTRTEKYYDATGKTVIATHVYTLSYDDDGELISEV